MADIQRLFAVIFLSLMVSSINQPCLGLSPVTNQEAGRKTRELAENEQRHELNSAPNSFGQDGGILTRILNSLQLNPAVISSVLKVIDARSGNFSEGLTADEIRELLFALNLSAEQWLETLLQESVSPLCQEQASLTFDAVQTGLPWALQMMDAMGKPASGMMSGHLTWLGSYDECLTVKAITYGNSSQQLPVNNFNGQYCNLQAPLTGSSSDINDGLSFKLGLCVPDGCSSHDISNAFQTVAEQSFNASDGLRIVVYCQPHDLPVETESIVCICVLSIIGSLMLIGTLYEVVTEQLGEGARKKEQPSDSLGISGSGETNAAYVADKDCDKAGTSSLGQNSSWIALPRQEDCNGPGDGTVKTPASIAIHVTGGLSVTPKQPATVGSSRYLAETLLAFSVYGNTKKILATSQAAGSLGSIHGIRFLTMTWIVLAHSLHEARYVSEQSYIFTSDKMTHWSFMAIFYATTAVDTFFAVSGLLVAYLVLQELKKLGGVRRFHWGMFYFHRYWRLTPPLALLIMAYVGIQPHISDGPLWNQTRHRLGVGNCEKNWWTNLLYVNNVVNANEMCMPWTWYLAIDTQLYVLSPLLLIPLFYNVVAGGLACLLLLAVSTVSSGLLSKGMGYPVQPSLSDTTQDEYRDQIYRMTYTRMGPYIIGILTGYILYRTKRQCQIPKVGGHWTGVLARLLSWKALIPLSRLTYCVYLIHPVVMETFYRSRREPTTFTDYELAYLFLGHLPLSYGLAFCMSLAFESPMVRLEKVFLKRERRT